jgi:hypothetical protein
MTRRRVLCGLLLASAVLACTLLIANGFRAMARQEQVRNRLTLEQAEGMTREELVRMVGPPDDSDDNTCTYQLYDRGRTLVVCFDEAGKVCIVDDSGCGPSTPPALIGKIRRWLGW